MNLLLLVLLVIMLVCYYSITTVNNISVPLRLVLLYIFQNYSYKVLMAPLLQLLP